MSKLNKLLLIGRLTRDAEVRDVNGDRKVLGFSVATDEGYKGKDGQWVDKAEFTDCSYFTTANGANFLGPKLHKGALVYVEGKKETQTYEKDGQQLRAVKCIVDEVRPLEKGERTEAAPAPAASYDTGYAGGYGDDAPPF